METSCVKKSIATVMPGALALTKDQIFDSASLDMFFFFFLANALVSLNTSSKNRELKIIPVHSAKLPR